MGENLGRTKVYTADRNHIPMIPPYVREAFGSAAHQRQAHVIVVARNKAAAIDILEGQGFGPATYASVGVVDPDGPNWVAALHAAGRLADGSVYVEELDGTQIAEVTGSRQVAVIGRVGLGSRELR